MVVHGERQPAADYTSCPALSIRTYTRFEIAMDPAACAAVAFVNAGLAAISVVARTFDLSEIAEAHRY